MSSSGGGGGGQSPTTVLDPGAALEGGGMNADEGAVGGVAKVLAEFALAVGITP